jgi:hypothetical protein
MPVTGLPITGVQSEFQQSAVREGTPIITNTKQPSSYSGTPITYLATDFFANVIVHNTGSSASTGNLPSAASLVAAIRGACSGLCMAGDQVASSITNTGTSGLLTLSPGAGGSLDVNQSAATIAAGTSKVITFFITNTTIGSESYLVYC